jgi:glycerol-3-phosphate O-acyltransferase
MHAPMPPHGLHEASWPGAAGDPVVFLLDASNGLERRLLEAWIEQQRPAEAAPAASQRVRIPASRRRPRSPLARFFHTPDYAPLDATLADAEPGTLLAPLRIAWLPPLRDGVRAVRLTDLLSLSDPRDPGRLRQRWILRRAPDRCRVVAGEPATLAELRERWSQAGGTDPGATTGLAVFVARQATLALERAERRLCGARYKVPRLLREEILDGPAFRGAVARLARESSTDAAALTRRAGRYLDEIAATHSPFVIDLVAHLIHVLYRQGYGERLQYDREQLAGIATLAQRHPVVFLPTHKSNLDHLVLQYALHEHGLPPNHTAGGINMNFFPVGPLVRRSGVFFIRRSFKDNPLYKLVLRSYVDYLIEKRFSLEWYIEGGRSRSGKLLPPRFGMLAYVVDAFRRGKSDDVHLIPVSIAYDQIQEVDAYGREQHGAAKERESFGWFLRVVRALRRRYGKIHIRFGAPLSLRDRLGSGEIGAETGEGDLALQKLAFEVSVRINRATPITPTSLVTLALLGAGDRAQSVEQTRAALANLLRYVELRKLPTTAELQYLATDAGVEETLEALAENSLVTRFAEGPQTVYLIGPEQQLSAAYYRNSVIHFFVSSAICELAVLHAAESLEPDRIDAFWQQALRLRDLLKFEFFFADRESFLQELRHELAGQEPDWQALLASGAGGARELVRRFRPFMAHRVLRPFLESYRVVADALLRLDAVVTFDEDAFLTDCLGLGKQYRLQHRIQSAASISKVIFQTALKLARHRGLLEAGAGPKELAAARAAFANEIESALRHVDAVVALAASRRAGLL